MTVVLLPFERTVENIFLENKNKKDKAQRKLLIGHIWFSQAAGNQFRRRSSYGSKRCAGKSDTETRSCPQLNNCPVDCKVSYFVHTGSTQDFSLGSILALYFVL